MRRIWIVYLFTVSLAFGQSAESRIDGIFGRFSGKGPGCTVGVARDKTVLFARAYGMADLEHDIPLSTKSAVYMASVSKQFAAMSILMLAEEGRLRTSDSIRKTIPELPEHANDITLYQLLTHTSGLRDYFTLGSLAGRPPMYTEDNVVRLLARQRSLNFQPGAEFLYSNSGYVLLSLVVKRVTGKNLDEFARDRIFSPLGMKSTRFQHDHSALVPGKAFGYLQGRNGWNVSNSMLDVVGDGGLYSSIEDMLLWTENFDTFRIGAKALALMQTPGRLSNGTEIGYGMGLSVTEYRGLRVVEHGGGLGGYRTEFLRFPDQKLSVVCLCNNGGANPSQLARRVAELYLSPEMKFAETAAPRRNLVGVALPAEELQAKAGLYRHEDRGYLEIVSRNGKLFRAGGAQLVALDKLRFTSSDFAEGVDLVFDLERPIGGFVVRPPAQPPLRYERVLPVTISARDMKTYAGEFHSRELDATARIAFESDSLVIEIGAAPRVRLRSVGRDLMRFEQDGLDADIVFHRDSDGKISGFNVDAGRVRKIQFERR